MFTSTKAFSGEFEHYYSNDPAFQTDSADFDHDKWIETADEDYLPRKNGVEPVRFTLRRMSSREWIYVEDVAAQDGRGSGLWMAVALSVRKITPYTDEEGKPLTPRTVPDGRLRRLSDEDMDRLATVDDGSLIAELAVRITKELSHDPL